MNALHVVFTLNAIALAFAGMASLWRLARGRTALDRAIALDVLTAILICLAAWTLIAGRRDDIGVLFITLTMVSFLSSTVIGRFGRRYRHVPKDQP